MFTEDLTVFFNTSTGHALAGVLNGATPVQVIFDRDFLNTLGIASTDPVAVGMTSQFPEATIGQTLLVAGTTYTIRNRRTLDDGAILALELTDG